MTNTAEKHPDYQDLGHVAIITREQAMALQRALQPFVHIAFDPMRARAPEAYRELMRLAALGEITLHVATILAVGKPAKVIVARVLNGEAEIVGSSTLNGGALVASQHAVTFN